MKFYINSNLTFKFLLASAIILLFLNFGNYYTPENGLRYSATGMSNFSNNGAYPVMWCDYLDEGDNATYQIISVTSNGSVIFETDGFLVFILGDINDQVDNGYYANLDSDFQFNGVEIPRSIVPPMLVPKKIYRACCGTFKPLTVQLADWGWENFSVIREDTEYLRLRYHNDIIDANITFNTDGLALDFNASLTNFSYSGLLISNFSNDSSTMVSESTNWDFNIIMIVITIITIIRGRKKINA